MDDVRTEMAALVPRLRRFAWALTGSREEGDDLVQAACLRALARLDQFRPGTRLDSWMFRIVQTVRIDRLRAGRRHVSGADPDAAPEPSDEGYAARRTEDRLTLARVRRAMSALPEEQRAVVSLVCIEGLSYREAAEALGTPVGTVMSRLARGRARLMEILGEL